MRASLRTGRAGPSRAENLRGGRRRHYAHQLSLPERERAPCEIRLNERSSSDATLSRTKPDNGNQKKEKKKRTDERAYSRSRSQTFAQTPATITTGINVPQTGGKQLRIRAKEALAKHSPMPSEQMVTQTKASSSLSLPFSCLSSDLSRKLHEQSRALVCLGWPIEQSSQSVTVSCRPTEDK